VAKLVYKAAKLSQKGGKLMTKVVLNNKKKFPAHQKVSTAL
jgi:hypothetical protein